MSASPGRHRLPARVGTVAAATALLLTTALAGTAQAHGTAIDPPARHYDCWERWGHDFQNPAMATEDPMCWQAWQAEPQAMWNWNGLYQENVGGNHQGAIADGTLCSGGRTYNGRYAAFDEIGDWRATAINNSFTVRVQDQALHGGDYYRVYVTRQGFDPLTDPLTWADLELVGQTGVVPPGAGDPADPGVIVNIDAYAPGRTGRHIVYTIWQASHFDQSYYMCSDVIFPGGGGPAPTTAPTTPAPSPTATTEPPPAPSPTPPAGPAGCSASYAVVGQWQGGFQAEVTVSADQAIDGWEVALDFVDGQSISQVWNASLAGSGSSVTASNVSWNGALGAGQSATFGFLGSWGEANGAPLLACTAS